MPLNKTSSFTDKAASSFTDLLDMVKDVSIRSTRSTRNSNSSKQNLTAGPTTELSLDEFEEFLSETLSHEVNSSSSCDGLHQMYQCIELDCFQDILNEMEIGLLSILKSYPSLPSPVVGEIHSYLGLVYLERKNNTAAVDAFLKALWFKSRTPEDVIAIAKANHRLGMAYAGKKRYKLAIGLLDRAIAAYEKCTTTTSSASSNSHLCVMAKEDRHSIQEAEQLDLLAKNRPQSIHRGVRRTKSNDENLIGGERRRRLGSRRSFGNRSFSSLPLPNLARQKTA